MDRSTKTKNTMTQGMIQKRSLQIITAMIREVSKHTMSSEKPRKSSQQIQHEKQTAQRRKLEEAKRPQTTQRPYSPGEGRTKY